MRILVSHALPFVIALMLLALPARADGARMTEARAHFDAGVALLSDPEGPRYEEAHAEFEKAYALSSAPEVLGNLGLCAMKLERDGEAIESYARYLAEVDDIHPAERRQIERDLQTLRVSVARVTVRVEGGTGRMTLVDTRLPTLGANVRNVYQLAGRSTELALRPGHHVLALHVDGAEAQRWTFDVGPAGRLEHTFTLAAEPAPPSVREASDEPSATVSPFEPTAAATGRSPSLVGPVLLTGVGLAGLTAGGILGVATLNRTGQLDSRCPDERCPPSAESDIDAARDFARATDATLVIGGVVTAAGVAWMVWTLANGGGDGGAPVEDAVAAPAAGCTLDGCMAHIAVRF